MASDDEQFHPIIDKPWEYRIADFRYCVEPTHLGDAFIDLVLVKDEAVRRLRFLAPRNLKIEPGFPQPTGGMCIRDIRGHQLDRVGVEVADFEASEGSVTFLARDVIDLDHADAPDAEAY